MKILLMSDSHGNMRGVKEALERFGANADFVIHCGDAVRGETEWLSENSPIPAICVSGNCDFNRPFDEIVYKDISGHRVLITHGHMHGVKFTRTHIAKSAKENGVDLVFYGHTHTAADETIYGVRCINPGALSAYDPSCAVVELDDKGNVLVNFLRLSKD